MSRPLVILGLEIAGLIFLMICAILLRHRKLPFLRIAWRRLSAIGDRSGSILLSGIIMFFLGALLTTIHVPVPAVHDEFSYLLGAETFASGRLTNPTHPQWAHLESFHIIHEPTYNSKYPPAQSLLLALGLLLAGHAIVGVWIGSALLAGATCWMLRGWVPGRWAFLGSLVLIFHSHYLFNWGQSFWGGGVGMLGGALLLGALPRVIACPRARDAILMAIGVGILANSRPFEGVVACLPVGLAMLFAWFRKAPSGGRPRPSVRRILMGFFLPASAVLVLIGGAMLYYNSQVTGDPLRMPYMVHEEAYGVCPLFLWQETAREPVYQNEIIRDFHTRIALHAYNVQQTFSGLLSIKGRNLILQVYFFLGGILGLCVAFSLPLLRRSSVLFATGTLSLAWLAEVGVPWTLFHYFSPTLPLLLLLVTLGMRKLRALRFKGARVGRTFFAGLMILHGLGFALSFQEHFSKTERQKKHWAQRRADLLEQLEKRGGQHLVVVRYGPSHTAQDSEWVYNEADIDASDVVWARDLGEKRNRDLYRYFRGRKKWLLSIDKESTEITPH